MTEKYEIIMFWSEEDQAFVADVPELPGCMAHGDSYESALANVREAIRLWRIPPRSSAIRFPNPKAAVSWWHRGLLAGVWHDRF